MSVYPHLWRPSGRVIELHPSPYTDSRDTLPLPAKRHEWPLVIGLLLVVAGIACVAAAKRPKTPKKPAAKPPRPLPSKEEMERRFAESDRRERELERLHPDTEVQRGR